MKYAVCLPNYGTDIKPDGIVKFFNEAEDLGYESVWATDHILMNKGSGTPYESITESITTISYLASKSSNLRLGISALIIAMRNPLLTAKQLATIDFLSNGRLSIAIGTGWNQQEFENLGSNFHDRGKRASEYINVIRALWEDKSTGKLSDVSFFPMPVQKRLPIYIAGGSMAAMRRAIALGDGWHPNLYDIKEFEHMVGTFNKLPNASQKEIFVRVAVDINRGLSSYTSPQGEKRSILPADKSALDILGLLQSLGVSGILLAPNYDGKHTLERQINTISAFAKNFI
ncbi:MAG: TIGR03619 family F420-dependent LLM class oxidoreductase [Conexivisphaerales archaeon]